MEKHALLYLRNYGPGLHFDYFLNPSKRQKGAISLSPKVFPFIGRKFLFLTLKRLGGIIRRADMVIA